MIELPRAYPWPKPTRTEQYWEQPCYTFLGGAALDGYALQNATMSLSSWTNPGSANQAVLKRVARYGAAIRLDKSKLSDAAAACYYIFDVQSRPESGFMNLGNRNEYSRGHLGLWMLGIGAAWVLATQEDNGDWSTEIAKGAKQWFQKLYGNLSMLSHKGIVLGPGWRDAADLESKNDDTLKFLRDGEKPKRRPKEWTNLNDAGCSVLYQLWTLLVLQDLGLMKPPDFPMLNADPTGLEVSILEGLPEYPYSNAVKRIVPRKEIIRWAYRVDRESNIWVQKQINPTTVTRPSEKDCPFMKVGRV